MPPMNDRLLAWVRIGGGLLIAAAIAFMISVLIDEGSFNPLNFFTFFTILSNLLAMAVLLEGGRRQLAGRSWILPTAATLRSRAMSWGSSSSSWR